MAVKFKVYQSKSKLGGVHGKYFARAYTGNDSVMDLQALAEHIIKSET